MTEHELKTDQEVFDASAEGRKNFEIRRNDRNFQVGDTLRLRATKYTGAEMKADRSKLLAYTGQEIRRKVTYILRGPVYGLAEGLVIMSVVRIDD